MNKRTMHMLGIIIILIGCWLWIAGNVYSGPSDPTRAPTFTRGPSPTPERPTDYFTPAPAQHDLKTPTVEWRHGEYTTNPDGPTQAPIFPVTPTPTFPLATVAPSPAPVWPNLGTPVIEWRLKYR